MAKRKLLSQFWKWRCPAAPTPPPPPPPQVYDINLDFLDGFTVPEGFWGINGARAFRENLKIDNKYWHEYVLPFVKKSNGGFDLLRNGGTVTFASRFDFSYTGNGYAKSVGSYPAIFSPQRIAGMASLPDLDEFVSQDELQEDANAAVNYHVTLKEALIAQDLKLLYVANPYQDAAELRSVIEFFGASRIKAIVAGNELNSPKAYRFGITPADLVYWSALLKPVCEEFGLQLGVGLPPYEYQDELNKGNTLGGKLTWDKAFAEHIRDNIEIFDFVCMHPYGQVPERTPEIDFTQWVEGFEMPDDYAFIKEQTEHFYALCGKPIYYDEHGLEKPEYGHINSKFGIRWHFERAMAILRMAQEYPIMGSCFQVLISNTTDGVPTSFIYDNDGELVISEDIMAASEIAKYPMHFSFIANPWFPAVGVETFAGVRSVAYINDSDESLTYDGPVSSDTFLPKSSRAPLIDQTSDGVVLPKTLGFLN